jgi:hypothetical protein
VSVLGRLCGATLASSVGAGVIVLADQAREIVHQHAELVAWLAAPTTETPACARGDAGPWLATLRDALASVGVACTAIRTDMSRPAAQIALLFSAGFRTTEHLEAAIVTSRLPGLLAEALVTGPQDLGTYPVKLPPFHYVEVAK